MRAGDTEQHVTLADGRSLWIRDISPEDGPALAELHRALSQRTVYQRFFAPMRELAAAQADRFTHVDGRLRVALVAQDPAGRLVAVARYDRLPPDFRTAETALVVADSYQGQGLGTTLMRQLTDRARSDDVSTFVADVLVGNSGMRHTFTGAGLTPTASYDRGVAHLVMPLPPEAE